MEDGKNLLCEFMLVYKQVLVRGFTGHPCWSSLLRFDKFSLFLVQRQHASSSLLVAGSVCAQRATREMGEYAMEMLQM